MQLNTRCLRCETTTNLNTLLKVKIEEVTYEVALCDQHAEDTTPKKARDMVIKKLTEFQSLVEKMKAFGYNVTETSPGGIVLPKVIEQPKTEQPTEEQPKEPALQEKPKAAPQVEVVHQKEGSKISIIGGKIAKEGIPAVKPISGIAKGRSTSVNIEGRNSVNINEAVESAVDAAKKRGSLPKEAQVGRLTSQVAETQTVRGRGGQPMTLPRTINHSVGGSTRINVVDTGGDRTIQERTKALSQEPGTYNYGQSGYDVDSCTLCKGTGVTAINGKPCPKCNGAGLLNKGWKGK